MSEDPVSGLDASPELMAGANLVKSSHKSGPRTRAERVKRRKEVYRLHFDLGYSASRVADMMQINRNTVNEDIKVLYNEAGKLGQIDGFWELINLQVIRIESQRNQLLDYREATNDIEKKVAITSQLLDLDFKLVSILYKIHYTEFRTWDEIARGFNEIAEKQKLDYRFSGVFELRKLSGEAFHKMYNLLGKETREKVR